ncbi:MAG TPA: triose-phosphate isomerase [bacterium (Candidatus Stahlbacteria)]|nr:triose-phosphate isomerase [Candidatus Stahlbacteria bacterium]
MRKPHIFGNWKMNKGLEETKRFLRDLVSRVGFLKDQEVAAFPPYVSLPAAREVLKGSQIRFGAQNVFYESPGAYTGEIALEFLEELGCSYVLVGHSERRNLGETDETINRKLKRIKSGKIIPVLCIGERLRERESGKTFSVVEEQLKKDLDGIPFPFIIAYEPVWAIGTGRTATPAQAVEVHRFIRDWLEQNGYPGKDVIILYGGSVKPENIDSLMAEVEIDGVLVGGASLDLDKFLRIIHFQEV